MIFVKRDSILLQIPICVEQQNIPTSHRSPAWLWIYKDKKIQSEVVHHICRSELIAEYNVKHAEYVLAKYK